MILRYTIMYVENVADSLAFYERAFGLTRGLLHEGGDYGELVTGETKLAFSSVRLMRQLGKSPAPANPDAPVFEIAFETDDVAAALEKAKEAGAIVKQDVRDEPWGQTTAYTADPNGYLVEICSPVAPSGS
ncbi:VOC family protein [Erythrobacter aureus]|uniref:VOC family protein n=1 Tax=Erythrobacter aureus TaxID=2182384 RepID=UPI003A8F881B